MISKNLNSMIKIYIFADSHKHFSMGIDEYKKRLGKKVELIELKPIKKGTTQQIIQTETEILREKLEKEKGYKVVLSPNGKNISTEEFHKLIETQKNFGNKCILVIGGASWINYDLLSNHIDMELSLGKMILPHWLALMLLLEQVYRCEEISKGSGYHK